VFAGLVDLDTAERRPRGNVFELMAAHRGLGIDHGTTTPDMGWEKPDYPYILSVIRPWKSDRTADGAATQAAPIRARSPADPSASVRRRYTRPV
jgi:hypothetical protein